MRVLELRGLGFRGFRSLGCWGFRGFRSLGFWAVGFRMSSSVSWGRIGGAKARSFGIPRWFRGIPHGRSRGRSK